MAVRAQLRSAARVVSRLLLWLGAIGWRTLLAVNTMNGGTVNEISVRYEGALQCRAEHAESGAVIVTDAPKDNHGNGASFSPSELLSVSLGSCILSIMGIMAQSLGLNITGATATVEKEMANAPRRIARISVQVHVPGVFQEDQRQRLEAAAHACPVHNILAIESPISFRWGS